MAAPMTSGWRRSLVAILLVALTLAGLGRAMASILPATDLHDVIPGVHVPICHAGEAPSDPARPSSHDCCDACALLAPATLPGPVALSAPAPVVSFAEHARAVAWAPVFARPRDPRLSRGPPAA